MSTATSPWQVLHRAGAPLAGERVGPSPRPEEIAAAVRAVLSAGSPPRGREAEALAALLFAWRHQWPTAFASAFPVDGDGVLAWARSVLPDAGRYLKLRRIAMANLATVL